MLEHLFIKIGLIDLKIPDRFFTILPLRKLLFTLTLDRLQLATLSGAAPTCGHAVVIFRVQSIEETGTSLMEGGCSSLEKMVIFTKIVILRVFTCFVGTIL